MEEAVEEESEEEVVAEEEPREGEAIRGEEEREVEEEAGEAEEVINNNISENTPTPRHSKTRIGLLPRTSSMTCRGSMP